jgi:phage shock protein PspC (stress-responsive transcriptional regulator)
MSNYESYPPPVPAQPAPRNLLVRSRSDKMIAGVCGGFADFTGFDVNLIRLVLVAATVLGAGSPIIVYLAAWLLMPEGD